MENIETTYNDEEEISLIDLFAVLIRFRKMIILGTVIVTFLAGLYLFLLPKIIPAFNNKNVSVNYTVELKSYPKTISKGLTDLGLAYDFEKNLTYAFKNYPLIAREYKKNPFMGPDFPKDSREYNYFIKDLVTTKKITINSNIGSSYSLDFEVPEEELETLDRFVKDFLEMLNKGVTDKTSESIDELERKSKQSLKELSSAASVSVSSSISFSDAATEQTLRETLQDIESLKNKPVSFYTTDEEPFILNVAQGRVKKLIIVCFAAFFIFVFAAFAKNAVLNIKADPEASKTIQNAWEAGK